MKALVDGLTDEQLKLFIALTGGIALVLGALITAIFGFCIARWTHNRQTAREHRTLAIQAALDSWKHVNSLAIDCVKHTGTGHYVVDDPGIPIAKMLQVIDIAGNMKLTPAEAAAKIAVLCKRPAIEYPKKAEEPQNDFDPFTGSKL